jgi:hypothetical protein
VQGDGATSTTELQKSNHETERRLRAIFRAPEGVQDVYREGPISRSHRYPRDSAQE